VLSLGSWLTYGNAVDQEVSDACVRTAFDNGINFFDTADIYARGDTERALGQALAGIRRQDYVLATKTFFPMSDHVNDRGLSRKHVFESCHASLKRLGTDYLDLYQCHRMDPETPVDEVLRAMEDLIRQGKVLYWGVSCWDAARLTEVCIRADHWRAYRPVTNQPPYNLLERDVEEEVFPTASRFGMGQIVYSPLAQGLLTGKYGAGKVPPGSRAADDKRGHFLRPKLTEPNLRTAARLGKIAAEIGATPAQLALAWVLRREEVSSAILGATQPAQIVENLRAARLEVPPEVMEQVDALTRPAARD
jgi:aryl-alcohol dehydrogenase-like predicted oxidoreductase